MAFEINEGWRELDKIECEVDSFWSQTRKKFVELLLE
jgi:hypothetical protein